MTTITHEVTNGFCTQCGDTEEWLRANSETVKETVDLYKPDN